MYESDFEEGVKKVLGLWYKKNKEYYKAAMRKIEQILENPQRYKSLRYDLKGKHRVHIMKSYVLAFRIDDRKRIVKFISLDHHDEAYK